MTDMRRIEHPGEDATTNAACAMPLSPLLATPMRATPMRPTPMRPTPMRPTPMRDGALSEWQPAGSLWRERTPTADDQFAGLFNVLEHMDVGILLLDADLIVVYMNRQLREIWGIPDSLANRPTSFAELARHAETMLWRDAALPERRASLDTGEQAIHLGAAEPVLIELPDGRQLRYCCTVQPDGGRIVTLLDVTQEIRQGGDAIVTQIRAELRFATETLESQAAYLVALAEETEETRKRADVARQMLEREIEERRTIEAQLRHVATTDSLTGVYNRAAFLSIAARELSRARRGNETIAILMLDADNFKAVNDRYGHAGGDAVLQHIASACRSAIRVGDSIGRLGGEEFAIVLPCASPEISKAMAERILERIAEQAVWHAGAPISVTVSIGVGLARDSDCSIEPIIARADVALYAAKNAGRNCVVLGTPA